MDSQKQTPEYINKNQLHKSWFLYLHTIIIVVLHMQSRLDPISVHFSCLYEYSFYHMCMVWYANEICYVMTKRYTLCAIQ